MGDGETEGQRDRETEGRREGEKFGRKFSLSLYLSVPPSLRLSVPLSLCDGKELYDQFEGSKVEIVSVSLDGGETTDTTLRDLKGLLADHPVDWPVIFDDTGWDNVIARSYGVSRLPTHIVIDREGTIRLIAKGGEKKKIQEVKMVMKQLM